MNILNEDWLAALAEPGVRIAREINLGVVQIIAQRIKMLKKLSTTDVEKITSAVQFLGADYNAILTLLRKKGIDGQKEIDKAIYQSSQAVSQYVNPLYKARGVEQLTAASNAYLKELKIIVESQTHSVFTNLSNTLCYNVNSRTLSVREAYIQTVDKAIYQLKAGTIDFDTVFRKSLNDLSGNLRVSQKGKVNIPVLQWQLGTGEPYYQRRFDSHVRQNIIDGVKQLCQQSLDYHGKVFGSDGVELSAHAIPAPDHAPAQGRQFSNVEFEKMQSGQDFIDIEGKKYSGFDRQIGEWNCRHFAFPIIVGISGRVYSDEVLNKYRKSGVAKYEFTQKQRRYEAKIRLLRYQQKGLVQSGDKIGALEFDKKIRAWEQKYKSFSSEHGLETHYSRTRLF